MGFQKVVRFRQAFGVVGDMRFDGPTRAAPYILATPGTPDEVLATNVIGHAFTFVDGAPGHVQAGGKGVFAGILVNSKTYAYWGTFVEGDARALYVPNGITGEFMTMGFVTLNISNSAEVGDFIAYNTATGALVALERPGEGATLEIPVGFARIPNAEVTRYPQESANGGPVLVVLTN